jgi:hypothetical protein
MAWQVTTDGAGGIAAAGTMPPQTAPAMTAVLSSKLRMTYPIAEEVVRAILVCGRRHELREIKVW